MEEKAEKIVVMSQITVTVKRNELGTRVHPDALNRAALLSVWNMVLDCSGWLVGSWSVTQPAAHTGLRSLAPMRFPYAFSKPPHLALDTVPFDRNRSINYFAVNDLPCS